MAGHGTENVITNETKLNLSLLKQQQQHTTDDQVVGNLCCCEYIDRHHRRHHLLACLCNCEDFDTVFTQFITCRSVDPQRHHSMLLTFQDRLRIPWRGGAKQFSYESCLPLVLLPLVLGLAAINTYTCILVLGTAALSILYAYLHIRRNRVRSRFFAMWLFASVLYMSVLFQSTVPVLELLPEENLILVLLTAIALFFMWRTRKMAGANQVEQARVSRDELPDFSEVTSAQEEEAAAAATADNNNDDDDDATVHTALIMDSLLDDPAQLQSNVCSTCRKYMPPRCSHCPLCSACFLRRDHHSYWLDCCIGLHNHLTYLLALLFGVLALLLGANLTLTAICHPFLVVRFAGIPFMLPDDCSEVFEEYKFGVSFIVAVYALLMSLVILYTLCQQLYFISRGLTACESQRGQLANRKSYATNWRGFLLNN